MVQCNCNKMNPNMSDKEAYLRAKLIMKCAEASTIKQEYEQLSIENKKLTQELEMIRSKLQDRDFDLIFCAGILTGYKDCLADFLE